MYPLLHDDYPATPAFNAHSQELEAAAQRRAYGKLVAQELASLRRGPVAGESPERTRLRARIGRWCEGLVAPPVSPPTYVPAPALRQARSAQYPDVASSGSSMTANCVLS